MCEVSTSESARIESKESSQNPPLLLSAKGSASLEALHSIVRGQSQVVPWNVFLFGWFVWVYMFLMRRLILTIIGSACFHARFTDRGATQVICCVCHLLRLCGWGGGWGWGWELPWIVQIQVCRPPSPPLCVRWPPGRVPKPPSSSTLLLIPSWVPHHSVNSKQILKSWKETWLIGCA